MGLLGLREGFEEERRTEVLSMKLFWKKGGMLKKKGRVLKCASPSPTLLYFPELCGFLFYFCECSKLILEVGTRGWWRTTCACWLSLSLVYIPVSNRFSRLEVVPFLTDPSHCPQTFSLLLQFPRLEVP